MSKTVKRVMTLMMIGLVAMLGVEAEAHTRYINGKWRICSIDAVATVEGMLERQVVLATLTVTAREVAIICEKNAESEILRGNPKYTTLIGESLVVGKADSVKFDISTKELFKTLGFCASGLVDARVRFMDAGFELSECVGVGDEPPDCSNRVLLSTMQYKDCKPDFKKPDDEKCFPVTCGEGPILDEEAHPGPLAE